MFRTMTCIMMGFMFMQYILLFDVVTKADNMKYLISASILLGALTIAETLHMISLNIQQIWINGERKK